MVDKELHISNIKSYVLINIAESYAKIGKRQMASETLEKAREITNSIADGQQRISALTQLSESYAKIGEWRWARQAAEMNNNDADKIKTYCIILRVWAERKNPNLQDMNFTELKPDSE